MANALQTGPLVTLSAPIAAVLGQLAINHGREFEADRSGAGLSGWPLVLASTLWRIENQAANNPGADANTRGPWG